MPAPGGGGPPACLAAVEQRGRPAAGQPAGHGPHGARPDLGRVVVVPALQGVLHLQPQPVRQRGQVRPFPAAGGLLALRGELRRVRAACPLPAPPVGIAQDGAGLGPQLAVADRAGFLPGAGNDGRHGGGPAAGVRFPRPQPRARVPGAKPAAAGPEPAAGHRAPGQRRVPAPRAGRFARSGERGGIRAPGLNPPRTVAIAHAGRFAARAQPGTRQAPSPNTGSA